MLTPLQLAVAYAAISNGGTLWEPRVGKAVVDADGSRGQADPAARSRATCRSRRAYLHYIDQALLGTAKVGTMAWKMGGFPLDQVKIRSKTGTAEVYGKQTTSWVASYDKQYVVIMQISQGGTGSGTSGDAVRKIWETLYGVHGDEGRRAGRRPAGRAAADRRCRCSTRRRDHARRERAGRDDGERADGR